MKRNKLKVFSSLMVLGLTSIGLISCGESTLTDASQTTNIPNINDAADDALSRLQFDETNVKKTYYEGQALDLTGLVVYAVYNNGDKKAVTNYTYDETTADLSTKGDKFVKIIYEENGIIKTRSLQILVKSILESSNVVIGLTAEVEKTEYSYQENLDLSTLKVTAYYQDGTTKELNNNEYKVDSSNFNNKMRGDYEIKVSYTEEYSQEGLSQDVTVETCFFSSVVLNMTSISITKGTNKFYQYSDLDISDWEVTVSYEEGVKEVIKSGFTTDIDTKFSDSSKAENGKVTVSFTYNGKTCTASKTVMIKPVIQSFNAGYLTDTAIPATSSATVGGYTVNPGYKASGDSQSCGCQSFAKSVTLDGTGTRDEYSIKFTTTTEKVLTIVATSLEGTELGLYNKDGNVIKTYTLGTTTERYQFTLGDASDYYIWSTGGAIIYYIGTYE